MRFPVARIVKETGFNKGYVSAVLQGKKPISDNFWQTFNEKFPDRQPDPATVILPTGDVKRTLADYIAIIELYNKTLSSAINAGLIDLKNNLKQTEANLTRGQQEIKEQILVTATAAVQQLSGQVPGVSVPLTGADKAIGGKKKVEDGDGKNKDLKP